MKITVFAQDGLSLTGGNVYDSLLYKVLKEDLSFSIVFVQPTIHESGFALKKLFTPFLALGLLKKLKESNFVFWNSVDSYHYLLLALCLRLFYPKKKVYILHHHYKFELMTGLKRMLFKFFEFNFLRMATAIIIPSPYILDQTRKFLPSSKICYLEIAFKDRHQNPGSSEVKKRQMLFVGTIEERKGLHLLLDALNLMKKENNDYLVNILGAVTEDNYYEHLLEKIKEYGLENNVKFRGRVDDEEKTGYMKTADFFIFPSLLEGYGMVIIEAMSFGLPVIAFNNSAIPYTVKDGYNGLLVENKDVHDLNQKISDVLNDTTLREKLSLGAFETFSKSRRLPKLMDEMRDFVRNLKE